MASPPVFAGWTSGGGDHMVGPTMKFAIDRVHLTDARGTITWNEGSPPVHWCEVEGTSGASVLSGVVAKDGAEEIGVTASFWDEQTITIARKGRLVYALRARPANRGRSEVEGATRLTLRVPIN
jgi:hypothetical protein